MISTRQLIFIIGIVFFFVNRATSGSSSSKEASRGSAGASRGRAEVNNAYLYNCILELTSAFQKHQTTFGYLLYAFLNLNEEDFIKRNTYTRAAYEYFHDLLNTAHDIKPLMMQNPQDYCTQNYKDEVGECLRSIAEMGCEPQVDGIFCVKNLYLNWKTDNSVLYSRPIYGTERMSDKELATAISRGFDKFPGLPLSVQDVASRLTDVNLLKGFYNDNEDRRENIECLHRRLKEYRKNEENSAAESSFYRSSLASNTRYANEEYTKQREKDIRDARFACYGVHYVDYEGIMKEQNRRHQIYKNNYAMFLYNQVDYWGKTLLDEEDKNKFQDPEKFCTNFLSNNPGYYENMDY